MSGFEFSSALGTTKDFLVRLTTPGEYFVLTSGPYIGEYAITLRRSSGPDLLMLVEKGTSVVHDDRHPSWEWRCRPMNPGESFTVRRAN